MAVSAAFQLPRLTSRSQTQLLRYAEQMLRAEQQLLTSSGQNILHYTLENHTNYTTMTHYPHGDRIDKKTGAQYFYHCHRENYEQEEHGHFHCFIRCPNIPQHIRPTPLPDWNKHTDNPKTHLIAIGMNRYGKPIRLFTTNRWVSSEIWYDAKYTKPFLKQFKMTLNDSAYWQVLDRWIEALLQLFSPQIIWLREARDTLIEKKLPKETQTIYNNKQLDELSTLPINLEKQIQWILGQPVK
ncbi:MAG: hypothetical protein K0U24_08965 [Gammaproteobacteria bacterium]|nr:hypothetical protein [Gammaproteobacteria bacterium]MCH9764333.1 hypothetical protein [Gammaproteobacteria bacterium]